MSKKRALLINIMISSLKGFLVICSALGTVQCNNCQHHLTFILTLMVQPWKRLPGKHIHECFIFSESLVNKTRKSQHTVRSGELWGTRRGHLRPASLPKDRWDVTTRWHPIWHVTNATYGTILKRHPHIFLCFLTPFTVQLVQIISSSICFQRHPSPQCDVT